MEIVFLRTLKLATIGLLLGYERNKYNNLYKRYKDGNGFIKQTHLI